MSKTIQFAVGIILLISMSSCTAFKFPSKEVSNPLPDITESSPTAEFPLATNTPVVITATPKSSPTNALMVKDIPTATSLPTEITSVTAIPPTSVVVISPTTISGGQTVKIFLVAIGDNGVAGTKFGCDDSLVAVDVPIAPTVGVLRAALNQLLAIKSSYYGQSGLYNSLYQSELEIDTLSIKDGLASIYLTGNLTLGGTCDSPRVAEQLKAIALQFSTVSKVEIFLNGTSLDEALSLK